jgi:hypothetical protein
VSTKEITVCDGCRKEIERYKAAFTVEVKYEDRRILGDEKHACSPQCALELLNPKGWAELQLPMQEPPVTSGAYR